MIMTGNFKTVQKKASDLCSSQAMLKQKIFLPDSGFPTEINKILPLYGISKSLRSALAQGRQPPVALPSEVFHRIINANGYLHTAKLILEERALTYHHLPSGYDWQSKLTIRIGGKTYAALSFYSSLPVLGGDRTTGPVIKIWQNKRTSTVYESDTIFDGLAKVAIGLAHMNGVQITLDRPINPNLMITYFKS